MNCTKTMTNQLTKNGVYDEKALNLLLNSKRYFNSIKWESDEIAKNEFNFMNDKNGDNENYRGSKKNI